MGTMFGGWLAEYEGRTYLVDCGVGAGAPDLVGRLRARLGPRPLDYILLTHIHLDHAGGLAEVLAAWPGAKAVVHRHGRPHLVRPARLWASTLEVVGEAAARIYGRPAPLEAGRLISHLEADLKGVEFIETPGHAEHHLSFRLGEALFVGEAGGCPYFMDGQWYSRPATPPRNFFNLAIGSLDRLRQEPDGPAYTAHAPEAVPLRQLLRRCRDQMYLWDELLRRPASGRGPGEGREEQLERLADLILDQDPDYRPMAARSPEELETQRFFLKNNILGFLLQIEESSPEALAPKGIVAPATK